MPIRLAAICAKQMIHIFDYRTRVKLNQIQLGYDLTSLNYSKDGREMLVNLSNEGNGEVWTMDEEGGVRQKFWGQKQDKVVIRSCFGGGLESVVVSGGEGTLWPCRQAGKLQGTVADLVRASGRRQNQHLAPLHRSSPRTPRRSPFRMRQRRRLEYRLTLYVCLCRRRPQSANVSPHYLSCPRFSAIEQLNSPART